MIDFKILDQNIGTRIQRDLDNSAALEGVHPRDYPHDIYLNGDQYYEWMNEMIDTYASRNPDNQSGHGQNLDWMNFGSTHEGREVFGFWMHGDASYTELRTRPTIAIDCTIHSREWISPAVCRSFINEYLRCGQANAENCDSYLLEKFYGFNIFILPMLNADGYYYSWNSDRLWRKNRTSSPDGPCLGTDLNRNSDVSWAGIGASDNTCSQTYYGVGPFSEPAMKAFKKACEFVNSVVAEGYWKGYISMHSYAQKIISSYAVSLEEFPHDPFSIDEMNASGKAISEAMTAVHGVTYTYGQSREILYPSSGTSKDWVLDDFQVPLSWTWELRDTGEYGFILPPEQIVPTYQEVMAGLGALVKYIDEEL